VSSIRARRKRRIGYLVLYFTISSILFSFSISIPRAAAVALEDPKNCSAIECYQIGYEKGYTLGLRDGHIDVYDPDLDLCDGHSQNYCNGYTQGYHDGFNNICNTTKLGCNNPSG
jgi:hypothetical protein